MYCRCDPPATAHFLSWYSRCDILDTADYLLTPQTLLLQMYTLDTVHLPSHCTTFSSNCRYDPIWCCTRLSLYFRCDIPDTAVFLLTSRTLSFYYRCTFFSQYTFFSSCTTFSSYCRYDPPGTDNFLSCTVNVKFFIMQTFSSHHKPCPSTEVDSHFDVVHSLLTLQNLLLVVQIRPSWYCTLSLLVLKL